MKVSLRDNDFVRGLEGAAGAHTEPDILAVVPNCNASPCCARLTGRDSGALHVVAAQPAPLPASTMDEFELLEPHPDIHALFQHYAHIYFQDKLGACSVEWSSKRMTL